MPTTGKADQTWSNYVPNSKHLQMARIFWGVHRLKRRAYRGSKPGGGGGVVGWWVGGLVCWCVGGGVRMGLQGVKVSILEVGSWILRVARCGVCQFFRILRAVGCQSLIFWSWGHGSWGLLGVKVSFFGAGVMDLEGCWVSRFHFFWGVGSWIFRVFRCQFWRWGHVCHIYYSFLLFKYHMYHVYP